MREIVFDTETTGVKPEKGDRIVEIGALELINHIPTGKFYHIYCNPQMPMPEGAFKVHGLSDDFLKDKNLFQDIADDFLAFIKGAKLIAHNAQFDINFLNHEFKRINYTAIDQSLVIDTLAIARKKFPGAQNSLDALCNRFSIDNSKRTKHGALLDSELLAEVYIELLGGRQQSMILGNEAIEQNISSQKEFEKAQQRTHSLDLEIDGDILKKHQEFIKTLGEDNLWQYYKAS